MELEKIHIDSTTIKFYNDYIVDNNLADSKAFEVLIANMIYKFTNRENA